MSEHGEFILLLMPSNQERRILYQHHTNSVSGQQPEWYWEWVCPECGTRLGDRDPIKAQSAVRRHVHP